MSNLKSSNLRPSNQPASLTRVKFARHPAKLLAAGAVAALLIVPLPLRAQDFGTTASSSPMGQLPQMAIGQEYQLTPDQDNPNNPPQFQPVPNGDPDDSSMNSDDNDDNSDDNADNGDNDQNQNDDNSDNDNSQDSSPNDNSPPPSSN